MHKEGITRGISGCPPCANLYFSLPPSSSVFPPSPSFKYMPFWFYLIIVFPHPALCALQSSVSLGLSLWVSLPFTQSCMGPYQQNQKQWVSCHAFHQSSLHKGWLRVFWSIAGKLGIHTVKQPALLTLVWWSNSPLRPEQPNEPNASADTDKKLCPPRVSVRAVITWWTLSLFGTFKLRKWW